MFDACLVPDKYIFTLDFDLSTLYSQSVCNHGNLNLIQTEFPSRHLEIATIIRLLLLLFIVDDDDDDDDLLLYVV